MSAMKAVRFGSYSRRSTVAGTSVLPRLKSTMRYLRLLPPPRRRIVMRPVLLRPPFSRRPSVSALTGLPFHNSLRSTMTSCRCDGVVGLKLLSAIGSDPRRHVDPRALLERDDRLLVVRPPADAAAEALGLALHPQRVDGRHRDLE